MEDFKQYCYKAEVVKVVDGDTLDVMIDLGLDTFKAERIRVAGINTPETYGVRKDSVEYHKGMKAKESVSFKIPPGTTIYLKTQKDKTGKYGRYLAKIYYKENLEWFNLGEELIKEGHAVKY